jgi:hypothetical protein
MKTFNQFINESVRDLMKPKSEEEINKAIKNIDKDKSIDSYERITKGIEYNILSLVKNGVEWGFVLSEDKTYFLELALLTNIDIEPNEIFLYLKNKWKPGKEISDRLKKMEKSGKELYQLYMKVRENEEYIVNNKPYIATDFDDEYIFDIENKETTDLIVLGISQKYNKFFIIINDYTQPYDYETIEEFEEELYNMGILK